MDNEPKPQRSTIATLGCLALPVVIIIVALCGGLKLYIGLFTPKTPDFVGRLTSIYRETEISDAPAGTAPYIRGKVVIAGGNYNSVGPDPTPMVAHNKLPSELRARTPSEVGTIVLVLYKHEDQGTWWSDKKGLVGTVKNYRYHLTLIDVCSKTRTTALVGAGVVDSREAPEPIGKIAEFLAKLPRR